MSPQPLALLAAGYAVFLLVASRALGSFGFPRSPSRGWLRREEQRFQRGMAVIVLGIAAFLLVAALLRCHERLPDIALLSAALAFVAGEAWRQSTALR